jgi:hypothetical protein
MICRPASRKATDSFVSHPLTRLKTQSPRCKASSFSLGRFGSTMQLKGDSLATTPIATSLLQPVSRVTSRWLMEQGKGTSSKWALVATCRDSQTTTEAPGSISSQPEESMVLRGCTHRRTNTITMETRSHSMGELPTWTSLELCAPTCTARWVTYNHLTSKDTVWDRNTGWTSSGCNRLT